MWAKSGAREGADIGGGFRELARWIFEPANTSIPYIVSLPLRMRALDGVRALFSYRLRIRLLAALLPARWWYRCASVLARWQDRVVLYARGRENAHAPVSLQVWMVELTKLGPFAIPQRVSGAEVLRRPGPKLVYFPHVLYFEVAIHAAVEAMGEPVPSVVSGRWRIEADGTGIVVGSAKRLPALRPDGYTLTRMKSLFREGMSVISLADPLRGGELKAEPMLLAGRLGAAIVFVDCDRGDDGVFDVAIREAPSACEEGGEGVVENMRVLEAMRVRDFARHPVRS